MTEWIPVNPCTACPYRVCDEQWPSCARCLRLQIHYECVAAQKQLLEHLIEFANKYPLQTECGLSVGLNEIETMLKQLEGQK